MTGSAFMLRPRAYILLAFLAAVSLGLFLFLSGRYEGPGFPLDDAWIHQTYARNLAQQGEWSFIPGQLSAGSTAPLWSAILAIGYWLKISPTFWVYLLGWLQLWLLGLISVYGLKLFVPERERLVLWGGVLMLFEFHLVWAAGSGMETLLDAILLTGFLIWLARPAVHWFLMGLWIGLSVWVRPDGITLLGPALMVLVLGKVAWQEKFVRMLRLAGGLFLSFGPYLFFNRILAGAWWPNTFFAKQAEYAILVNQPFLARFASQLVLPLVGIGIVLVPGFVWRIYRSLQKQEWASLAAAIWLVGFLFLYAWRLPVTYQHGRYVMPVMPVYFIWGLAGFFDLADLGSKIPLRRILSKAWVLTGGIVILFFWVRGAFAYAQDVAVIQTEMVATASWVADHTPPESLIAAHDIGALGYFGNRQLVDLAGLISPEVIPFIRDEDRLIQYLDRQKVDFLVTFPGWYPKLIKNAVLIHSTDGKISPSLGGENMQVYRWLGSEEEDSGIAPESSRIHSEQDRVHVEYIQRELIGCEGVLRGSRALGQ